MTFITELENTFAANSNAENALPMAKYMKNLFSFFNYENMMPNSKIFSLSAKAARDMPYVAIVSIFIPTKVF